jgi:two-component system, NtrC family, sensor histidine kinase HydH
MRWFALSGAAAIGLFSVAMALMLGAFIDARMLANDAEVSRDFVQSIAATQRLTQSLADPSAPGRAEFLEFVAHVAAIPGVLRTNVYAADRTVLWSSRAELIGQRFADNDELDQALAGRVVVHRAAAPGTAPDKPEHLGIAVRGDGYVENYLPVYDEEAGVRRLVAVVELYRNQAVLFAAIRDGQRLVWMGSLAGGLFLFATLIWFVRRAERALREQQGRLVEAEALAIVGEVSAAVAHSIRNPLGSIRSTAELQLELGADRAAMGEIMRGVDRVDVLVSTLLNYAADPTEHAASADLDAVIAAAQLRFEPEFGTQGKPFAVTVQGPLGRVAADPVLMAQVLDSLLANAGEATVAGEAVELVARRKGAHTIVEVRDAGRGVGEIGNDQVFKPFYTTKPRGLGMGLALVKRVVRRLDGRITLEPAAGRGTVARLELPVR